MDKQEYEAPWGQLVITQMEGLICLSGEPGLEDYQWNPQPEE